MIDILFYITFFSIILLDITMILTIYTNIKFWPPQDSKFKLYFNWILTYIFIGGIIILGPLDYNSFIFNFLIVKIIGVVLFLIGVSLSISAMFSFKVKETLGISIDRLKTDGIYSVSRNPQYIGDILWFIGYMLFFNSSYLYIIVPLSVVWFFIAPFTEEPLLFSKFNNDFTKYKMNVPRFINLKLLFLFVKDYFVKDISK